MISLTDLLAAMPSYVEMVFTDGVIVIAKILSIDDEVDSDQIFYKPLKVVRAPPGSVDQPGRYISVDAQDVVSWRVYNGPKDWEDSSEADKAT